MLLLLQLQLLFLFDDAAQRLVTTDVVGCFSASREGLDMHSYWLQATALLWLLTCLLLSAY